jgi:flagellar biosynthesis/type III secretory pathway M-ring protein FliF/YscJ
MTIVVAVLVVLLVVVVVALVSAPLRRRGAAASAAAGSDHRDELEAARDAKYRELRDLDLDYRTGKLSDEDFAALDRALRAEAIAILRQLDELD